MDDFVRLKELAVEEWLTAHGLAHRIPAFAENGITQQQFGQLTEHDLRELGLTIGERKRFLSALADTSPAQATALGVPSVPPSASPVHPPEPLPAALQGERRPLTVMFVDLVDSTPLGERLDPEDLVEVIRQYRTLCNNAIARFGGRAIRYIGDGVLAYFCYPIANENDPERATRASLAIMRGLDAIQPVSGERLQARIGIATGPVVISDLFEGGMPRAWTAAGSVPNLAARLQGLARPNGIVVSEATYSRIRNAFECEPIGSIDLKGFASPREPWRVLGERSHSTAREQPRRLTPLQGRDAELAVMLDRWQQTLRGRAQIVLLQGEAGIGKSRLVEEMVAACRADDVAIVGMAASAFDEDSPLRPMSDHLRLAARLDIGDDQPTALAKLEAIVLGDPDERARARAIMANLVGVQSDDPVLANLLPEQLRERTVAVLIEQLMLLAGQRPVCVVVEDLHWLDPTSRSLLDALAERIAGHRVMLLLSTRPGITADWIARPQTTVLRLERLSDVDVVAMIRSLFGAQSVSDSFALQLVRRTDGVPLFVEEVGRLLIARGAGSESDQDTLEAASQAIPESLHESLMARLDRSRDAREVAQIAAVIGRSTRYEMLAAVAGMPPDRLEQPIAALVESGILDRHTHGGRDEYEFSHALLRDAAYGTLLRDRRRSLHARVARMLIALDPAGVQRNPEVLALHLSEADLPEEAAPRWLEAASRSLARSALTEAIRMLRRALSPLEALAPTEQRIQLRLQISALLGPALSGLMGPNAPETRQLVTTAYELCRDRPDDEAYFPIYWGWWRLLPTSLDRATGLLNRARSRGDPAMMLEAHHCNWASHLNVGLFARCCEHAEAGLARYDTGDFRFHARLYGNHDAKVCAHGALSQAYWMLGRLRSAIDHDAQSMTWAAKLDHLGSRVHALGMTLLHQAYRRDYASVIDRANHLIALTTEHGMADHGAAGLIFRGWAIAQTGDPVRGLAELEHGLGRQRETATIEDIPVYLCLRAEILSGLGQPDRALAPMIEERPGLEGDSLGTWMPELLRVTGEMMLAADPASTEAARKLFAEAETLADSQGCVMLAARIALSQARLDERLGDRAAAARRMRAALSALPEFDGSADLMEAYQFSKELGENLLPPVG
jgi:class 3 adenylate cyclase/predicted ATPase